MIEPIHIGNERQLFIDDYCIEELCGVRRQFHQAEKHPSNPILIQQEPWEETYLQLYGNILYDMDMQIYRMWYSARYAPDGPGSSVNSICHATSTDGIHWERTKLNQCKHNALVLKNAVMKGKFIGPTVFHTPEDPDPARRYRMFVFSGDEIAYGQERQNGFGDSYSVFFSPDGFSWTEYEKNPVIQGGDISTCMYDPLTKDYMTFPKVHRLDDGRYRRSVGVSASKDFLKWGAPHVILSADQVDDARVESRLAPFRNRLVYDDPSYYHADMYGMTGFRYEGLRLGLIWFFDKSARRPRELGGNEDGIINVQLAYSRDLDPYGFWHRAGDRYDFLPCGREGQYDSACIYTAHTVIEHEEEIWIYYTGYSRSHGNHGASEAYMPFTKKPILPTSIHLATLRKDGFASVEALYPSGTMTTKLLTFDAEKLIINADAEKGSILVELIDHEGKPIPGYTKEECVPFRRNDIRGEIQWKSDKNISLLHNRVVRIRFYLQTTRLYSFLLF